MNDDRVVDEQLVDAPMLDRAVRRMCAWKRDPLAEPSERGAHKEWMHFCVRLPGDPIAHLLVNFSIVECRFPSGISRSKRVIAFAHTNDGWTGSVEDIDAPSVRGGAGQVDIELGPNRLAWRDGMFLLMIATKELRAELKMRPLALPTPTSSVCVGPGHAMHWAVLPRLVSSGVVEIGERRFTLRRAPTYHDHNWGYFRWGGDLAWEWGFVHPNEFSCPWSVVFVRVSDGARHHTLSQGLLLWERNVNVRTFQNEEIRMDLESSHVGMRPFTLPPGAGLLVPGAASGVPRSLRLEASGAGDDLVLEYQTAAKARLALPDETDDFNVVLLNETVGEASFRGHVRGTPVSGTGPAIVEFIRG